MAEEISTVGRPSKYDPEYHPKEAEYLSSLGIIDLEIAKAFDIVSSTFYDWKRTFPEFSEALKRGKATADQKVVDSLYKRACGTFVTETKRVDDGSSVRIETTEKYVADTTAMIFWLTNRQKEDWKRMQSTEVSGPEGKPLVVKVLKGVSMDDL